MLGNNFLSDLTSLALVQRKALIAVVQEEESGVERPWSNPHS